MGCVLELFEFQLAFEFPLEFPFQLAFEFPFQFALEFPLEFEFVFEFDRFELPRFEFLLPLLFELPRLEFALVFVFVFVFVFCAEPTAARNINKHVHNARANFAFMILPPLSLLVTAMIGGMNYASDVKPNNYERPALYGSGHLTNCLARHLVLFNGWPQSNKFQVQNIRPPIVGGPILNGAVYKI